MSGKINSCKKRCEKRFKIVCEAEKILCNDILCIIAEYVGSDDMIRNNICSLYSRLKKYSKGDWWIAIYYEKFDIIKILHKKKVRGYSPCNMDSAAEKGRFDIIKWLHQKGYRCTFSAMDKAAENGYLEIVKWLHENRKEGCSTRAMDSAAENGHLEVVKWLHIHRTEGGTYYGPTLAAQHNHFEVVRWLYKNRPHEFDDPKFSSFFTTTNHLNKIQSGYFTNSLFNNIGKY
jgi:hypothetical protein